MGKKTRTDGTNRQFTKGLDPLISMVFSIMFSVAMLAIVLNIMIYSLRQT